MAAIALAGCGPSDAAPSPDLAGAHVVAVGPAGSNTFAPDPITIAAGDTVEWIFMTGSHTVTSGPVDGAMAGFADGAFCSGAPEAPTARLCGDEPGHTPGFTYAHTFTVAGDFPYFCNVHGPPMRGTVIVR
jgi:plastocyanin